MAKRVAMSALVSFAVTVVACSSSNNGGGGGGAPDSSSFGSQYCALFKPCCAQAGLSTSGTTCLALVTIAGGQGTYNPTQGSACISGLQQDSSKADFCTTLGSGTTNAACNGVFGAKGGAAKPGDACMVSSDCAPSTDGKVTCFGVFTGSTETRTCQVQVPGKAGDSPCVGTVEGSVTFFQWSSTDGPTPTKGFLCDKGMGLECNTMTHACTALKNVGDMCTSSNDCVTNAYCDFMAHTCTAKLPAGSSCAGAALGNCDTTTYCEPTSMKCTPTLAAGAACTSGQECQSSSCVNNKCGAGSGNLGLSFICGTN